MVFTTGLVDAVQGNVDGERSHGMLHFVGLDVDEARHRSCVGVPVLDAQCVRS